jgi:hypothetical protein
MPTSIVPAAPMPVQTAYAVPNGTERSDMRHLADIQLQSKQAGSPRSVERAVSHVPGREKLNRGNGNPAR